MSNSKTTIRAGRQAQLRSERTMEKADPRTLELPTGLGNARPVPLREQILSMVRNELSDYAAAQGKDTFEAFDNFDDPDEYPDDLTIYQAAVLAAENPEQFDAAAAEVAANPPSAQPSSAAAAEDPAPENATQDVSGPTSS